MSRRFNVRSSPIQTIAVAVDTSTEMDAFTVISRRWELSAAAECRLCPLCTARLSRDGFAACVVVVPGRVPQGEAPFYELPAGPTEVTIEQRVGIQGEVAGW